VRFVSEIALQFPFHS